MSVDVAGGWWWWIVEISVDSTLWKALFFDRHEQDNNDAANNDHLGFNQESVHRRTTT